MSRSAVAFLFVVVLAAGRASAQPTFEQPKAFLPDEATLKEIVGKTEALKAAIAFFPKSMGADIRADVEVYLKAAEWTIRHGEWFHKDSGKHTLAVIAAGRARADAAAQGKTPWRDVRGKPIVRGYVSGVDGSVQPYSIVLPEGFGTDDKKWRLDIVLHGRDQTLTEVKFIQGKEASKGAAKGLDHVILEVYGRGNNAYRWAGETDVSESLKHFLKMQGKGSGPAPEWIDSNQLVLRGFSMGGAGTWHIGLHHPFSLAVIGPGAGFTATRGYIKNLPPKLPDYQEKCLHIYDAVDYAENAFNVPVVAYSGEKDPQKAAADNIEAALKNFKGPLRFTHLVAPGLEHQMPAAWQAKAEAEYQKYLKTAGDWPERIHFVTYTSRYHNIRWGIIRALDRQYERATVDGQRTDEKQELKTTNVRAIEIYHHQSPARITIDGQLVAPAKGETTLLVKTAGRWEVMDESKWPTRLAKEHGREALQGPIDDAFMDPFEVVPPAGTGWHEAVTKYATGDLARFEKEWDTFFRGRLRSVSVEKGRERKPHNLVLFGDPGSNPLIEEIAGKLPIKWTKETLEVNGVTYDPKTHVPVLIYPNPLNPTRYVVINSGHTFHAAELKGTNAQLYPRLGDWAVLKLAPTAKDPLATEVVAAGLFDEFWQFPKR
ncbi:hypothetical protein [Fimbriiglobus ruber]|uniref:Peptidase S9 prolyl oligopeptidase catalytic domain-containing protein n=1 Tax=Fimbriiglobus ruber TaxID=1908690 RepID=A0A225E0Y6_9BACT|nr:hypothetical protein [Fimbriiglobus ruber]OWK42355.1 hypothetical protein FRUB_04433 [Fimbriiglobus ruber]